MSLRVVAGDNRGRRLVTPDGDDVRPTSDRVREAVFNSLGSMDALRGASVLDLFCGSGALGIEALSRGADHVTFVDASNASLRATSANLATCGLDDRATVVRSDALRFLEQSAARDGAGSFDLALLDPPYAFGDWPTLLGLIDARVVVIESDRSIDLPVTTRAGELVLSRERRYGGTFVTTAIADSRVRHDGTSEGRK